MTAGFDLFTKKWTWWLRIIISSGGAALALALLLTAMIWAVVFLVKYHRNPGFANNYLNGYIVERWPIQLSRREAHKYYANFTRCIFDYTTIFMKKPTRFATSMKLLMNVTVCFLVERAAQWIHDELAKIQFYAPNFGEAKFTFNVQGEGFFASVMRSVLGGFSLHSKVCQIADSSVCDSKFIPVDWRTWVMLFSLAIFYFAIGIYQTKSDYIMCRICDFLMREQEEKRTIYVLEEILVERAKRKNVVVA